MEIEVSKAKMPILANDIPQSLERVRTIIERDGAKTQRQIAVIPLLESLKEASKDFALAKHFLQSNEIESVLISIVLEGSAIERMALGRCLKPAAAAFMPDVYTYAQKNYQQVSAYISAQLRVLAAQLGATLHGDIDSMTYTIMHEFGGLSLLDFIIFFQRASTMKYRQDYQHVSARGLTYEFLKSWLDEYTAERESDLSCYRANYSIGKAIDSDALQLQTGEIVNVSEVLEQSRKKREQEAAKELYVDSEYKKWVRDCFEQSTYTQHYKYVKTKGIDGEPVTTLEPCAEGSAEKTVIHPVLLLTYEGACKQTKRIIYEHGLQEGSKCKELFESWLSAIPKANRLAEMKKFLFEFSSMKRVGAEKYTELALRLAYPNEKDYLIMRSISTVIEKFTTEYKTEYLPSCEEIKYVALPRKEYVWKCAYLWHCKVTNKNPILTYFNYEA